jgi:hypothetical protein
MADQTEQTEPGGRTAVASYVATLSADLAVMRAQPRHPRLSARNGAAGSRKRYAPKPRAERSAFLSVML